MALVGSIVARFSAETSDYLAKSEQLKAKNRETAQSLIAAAGSAEAAIASLQVAKRSGGNPLADVGIDKRNVNGIIAQIKDVAKEAKASAAAVTEAMVEAFIGPPVKARFDKFTQEVRDAKAKWIKDARDAARAARVDEAVKLDLFGDQTPAAASKRPARFAREEQEVRDEMARRMRSMREAARQARVANAASMRLFGETDDDRRNRNDPIRQAAEQQERVIRELQNAAKRAGGLGDVGDSFELFGRGDFIAGIEKWKRGMGDIREAAGVGGRAIQLAFGATIMHKFGEATAEATGKMLDLQKQFNEGKIGVGEMVEKGLAALPVLGGIWQTGRNIREMLTGENAEYERQAELLKTIVDARQRTLDIAKELRDHAEGEATKNEDIAADANVVRLRAAGKITQAAELAAANKLARDQRQAEDDAKKFADDKRKRLSAELNASVDGNTSLRQRQAKAMDRVRELEDKWQANPAPYADELQAARNEAESIRQAIAEKERMLKQVDADEKSQAEARKKTVAGAAAADKELAAAERAKQGKSDLGKSIKETLEGLKIKATPITDWIAAQVEKSKAMVAELKADAERFREQTRTPAETVEADIRRAVKASQANPGTFGAGALSKYVSDQRAALVEQMKSLESSIGQRAYQLPDVKELRAGQTLYAAPESDSKQMLKKLDEVKAAINKLDTTAAKNKVEVIVNEVSK